MTDASDSVDTSALKERDVTLTVTANGPMQQTNHMLQDAVHLQRFLYIVKHFIDAKIKGSDHEKAFVPPTDLSHVEPMARKIYELLARGKSYERACLRTVPFAYLSGPGRIMDKDGPNWKQVSEDEAIKAIGNMILEGFKADHNLSISPYSDFVRMMEREAESSGLLDADPNFGTNIIPELKDVILLPRDSIECSTEQGESNLEKLYENQVGNGILFNLASQFVTSTSNTPERRVRAALSVLQGLNDVDVTVPASMGQHFDGSIAGSIASRRPRFLVRDTTADGDDLWKVLNLVEAVEFVSAFIFEVWLEKESPALALGEAIAEPDTSVPIKEPSDQDVLLGRGGLTNSWPGNKRFRDIIALHRADYIRAIKMDKPAVARKIVRAIRIGNPPGRFLRKSEAGIWYDTGDKTAAEKTSQGLRERSNIEKRQRTELRKALRIRKVDLQDDDEDGADGETDHQPRSSKKPKYIDAASIAPTLNYVGTSLPVPLSLSMAHVVSMPKNVPNEKEKSGGDFVTEGLPPNAVDAAGNILVTDYDILCGRGGLTNHHKGNRRFRDIVTLHRPDYIRASKIQKPSVSRVIVRAIRNGDPPGRFLKKDEKSGKWIDIGDKKAAEKTSQALREKPEDESQSVGLHSIVPHPLFANSAVFLPGTTATVMGNLLAASAYGAAKASSEPLETNRDESLSAPKLGAAASVPDTTAPVLESEEVAVVEAGEGNVGVLSEETEV